MLQKEKVEKCKRKMGFANPSFCVQNVALVLVII